MDQTAFLGQVEEILDSDPGTVLPESVLQDLEGWDSVAALSLIAMIDERWGVALEGSEILACHSVGDLFALVQQRASGA